MSLDFNNQRNNNKVLRVFFLFMAMSCGDAHPANIQRKYNVVQRCKKVIFTML